MPGFPFYIAIPAPLGKRRSRPCPDEVTHGGIERAEFVGYRRVAGNIKFKSCTRPATSSPSVTAPSVFHRERLSISHILNAASADQPPHEPAFAVTFRHRVVLHSSQRFRIASLPPQKKPPVIRDFSPDDGEQFRVGCTTAGSALRARPDEVADELMLRCGFRVTSLPGLASAPRIGRPVHRGRAGGHLHPRNVGDGGRTGALCF